jgi:tetratricopeptide (TPR) repeat protein/tRNA A-37 threonylcarbamoyl transferase component Bud32
MGRLEINPASWSALNRLLDEALDMPPADRVAWMEGLSAEFAELKPRLRELLARASSVETGDFLRTLPKFHVGGEDAATRGPSAQAGQQVGGYRLLRELGSGGMGSVWLAERADGLIQRPVALKLPHSVDSRHAGLAERMARERDILGALDHRNIAKLLDAGVTEAGQPFLALEYVEGEAIDRHCAAELGAAGQLGARLKLFRQVADAVAYAHGKLVLHRDLKPANILVTAGGGVKLLDFGIAKLLAEGKTAETRLTEISGRALTPDYASPEQILGEPLTVASDVYSLGVVLFELLTGTRPYRLRRDSRGALEDAILQGEPPRASQVAPEAWRSELRGDLDTIVGKALKKVPAERYATVNALVDDVTRYLEHRPVLARPDSTWYRARKFVARNRAGVAATAVVAVAVIAGAGVAVWQAVEAREQRDAALRQQRRAESYADFTGVLLQDAGAGPGGKMLTPTELVDRGVAMLERQTGLDDNVSAYMWYEMSRNYLLFINPKRELELLDRAVAGAQRIGDAELMAASHCSAAWTLAHNGLDLAAAKTRLAQGLAALARSPQASNYAIMDCARGEARLLHADGDTDGAIEVLQRGRARLARTINDRNSFRSDPMITQLSDLYRSSDRFKEALALAEESLRSVRAAGRAGSYAELVSLNNYAGNLCRLGEITRCAAVGEETLKWLENAATAERAVSVKSNVSVSLLRLGQAERALKLIEEDRVIAVAAGNVQTVAIADLLASRALLALGRHDEARKRIAAASAVWARNPTAFRRMLFESKIQQADIEFGAGDGARARSLVEDALAGAGYPHDMGTPGLDRLLRLAATINLAMGDAPRAERLAHDALQISTRQARSPDVSADVGMAALLRALARDAQGRRAAAIEDLKQAVVGLRNGYGEGHADTLRAQRLAREWGLEAVPPVAGS